jgi:hypothetical protein
MEKVININHGLPQTPYFIIAQPKKEWGYARTEGEKTIVNLTDPKNNQVSKAELHAFWTMDKKEFLHSQGFCKLAYGCEPKFLYDNFMAKNPELKDGFEVEYWLLKRIN